MKEWTTDEIARFKKRYGSNTDEALAAHFGVPLAEVAALSKSLALGKDKGSFIGAAKMPRWTKDEVQRLRELYPNMANVDIARELGKTVKAVNSKAHLLRLKKAATRLATMGKENVKLRRDRKP